MYCVEIKTFPQGLGVRYAFGGHQNWSN